MIRRQFQIGKYPFMISLSLGRNPKAFKRGHWYNIPVGCGCGNPRVPHEGIYEDFFYACANLDVYAGPLKLHVWMNNRNAFGSFYSFYSQLIRRHWIKKGYAGVTFSILSNYEGDFQGPQFQWSEDP